MQKKFNFHDFVFFYLKKSTAWVIVWSLFMELSIFVKLKLNFYSFLIRRFTISRDLISAYKKTQMKTEPEIYSPDFKYTLINNLSKNYGFLQKSVLLTFIS